MLPGSWSRTPSIQPGLAHFADGAWRIRAFHEDDLDAAVRLWAGPAAGSAAPVFVLSDRISAVRAVAPVVGDLHHALHGKCAKPSASRPGGPPVLPRRPSAPAGSRPPSAGFDGCHHTPGGRESMWVMKPASRLHRRAVAARAAPAARAALTL